ncbi:MAG: hypothetical protein WCF50_17980 [Pseudolabrys sp.]
MEDQLITILEAIRLAKAELRTHNSRPVENAPRTLKRLEQILFNENVTRALGLLSPDVDGPSMVPDQHEEYSP